MYNAVKAEPLYHWHFMMSKQSKTFFRSYVSSVMLSCGEIGSVRRGEAFGNSSAVFCKGAVRCLCRKVKFACLCVGCCLSTGQVFQSFVLAVGKIIYKCYCDLYTAGKYYHRSNMIFHNFHRLSTKVMDTKSMGS